MGLLTNNRLWVFVLFCALSIAMSTLSAEEQLWRFDRPSVCEMMVARQRNLFEREIETAFREKDAPERFNDHSLGVKVVRFSVTDEDLSRTILQFCSQQQVAKKMIARWFDRDKESGAMDMLLISERGLYNANSIDVSMAAQTIRGMRSLEDAGEKLIPRTFLVVHDYYFNTSYGTQKQDIAVWEDSEPRKIDVNNQKDLDRYNEQLYAMGSRLQSISIGCVSYLFQLNWNDSVAGVFYENYYTSSPCPDVKKKEAFNADRSTFTLRYIGKTEGNITERNTQKYNNQVLVKKACVRLVDYNLACLQHKFSQFRVMSNLTVGSEGELTADIGLKEDVRPGSRFEVLLPKIKSDGSLSFTRIGIIRPIADKISDNRFMAGSEQRARSTFFEQVSGGELFSGLLIREL